MTTVEEIQTEIEMLSQRDYKRLLYWMLEKDWENWDSALEKDVASGKLDFLIEEAMDEKEKGILKVL